MIRKLILPAAALLLLAGCATGYSYRTAPGDYYYGQPGTVYRDYYGYPSYYSPYGWSGYFGYGYRYGYGYPYGYYSNPWRHHHGYPHYPRPGNDGDNDQPATPDRPTPPWRDLDRVGAERGRPNVPRSGQLRTRPVQPPMPQVQRPPTQVTRPAAPVRQQAPVSRPAVRPHGSAMSEMIRRAQPNRDVRRSTGE